MVSTTSTPILKPSSFTSVCTFRQSTLQVTFFLSRFGTVVLSSLTFAKQLMHFLKQFVQTEPQNGLPAKDQLAQNPLFITQIVFINTYVSEHVSAIRMTSPCVIVYRKDSQKPQPCCQYSNVLEVVSDKKLWLRF